MPRFVEYIWQGGAGEFRSKVKIVADKLDLTQPWNYDGSSTGQATTESSECILKPVRAYNAWTDHVYLLCSTPEREEFMKVADHAEKMKLWLGFEQEFFIYDLVRDTFLGSCVDIPEQGKYYCGVQFVPEYDYSAVEYSRSIARTRDLTDKVARKACDIGLHLTGYNLEVAPGQTEIQVMSTALEACDDLTMLRFIAHRVLGEDGFAPIWDPKPLGPDWNGSGLHTNVSTSATRAGSGFDDIMRRLEKTHGEHIAVYGAGNEERLTGIHETSSMDKFTWSVGGRHTSVRIPGQNSGYFEDRRPAANANPYLIAKRMTETLKNE